MRVFMAALIEELGPLLDLIRGGDHVRFQEGLTKLQSSPVFGHHCSFCLYICCQIKATDCAAAILAQPRFNLAEDFPRVLEEAVDADALGIVKLLLAYPPMRAAAMADNRLAAMKCAINNNRLAALDCICEAGLDADLAALMAHAEIWSKRGIVGADFSLAILRLHQANHAAAHIYYSIGLCSDGILAPPDSGSSFWVISSALPDELKERIALLSRRCPKPFIPRGIKENAQLAMIRDLGLIWGVRMRYYRRCFLAVLVVSAIVFAHRL